MTYNGAMNTPLHPMPEIPTDDHPGAFGAVRTHDIHTGVDLYCSEGDLVYAMEPGLVVGVCDFTGVAAGSPWWNDTQAILIEGADGVTLYGEVDALVSPGDLVYAGQLIAFVKRVLVKDKGRPMDMLHLERYEPGYRGTGEIWHLGAPKPDSLVNPTKYILDSRFT